MMAYGCMSGHAPNAAAFTKEEILSKTLRRIPAKHVKRSGAGQHTPKVKKPPKYRIDWSAPEMDYGGLIGSSLP